MIYKHNGVEFNIHHDQEIGGITYPAGTLLLRRDEWVTLKITEHPSPTAPLSYPTSFPDDTYDVVIINPDNSVTTTPKTLAQLETDRAAAVQSAVEGVEADSDAIVSAVLSSRATEYLRVEAQARAYIAAVAADPSAPIPSLIQADANLLGITPANAAGAIIVRADGLMQIQDQMRIQRRITVQRLNDLNIAYTQTAVAAEYQLEHRSTLDVIASVVEAHTAFLANVQLQLGLT